MRNTKSTIISVGSERALKTLEKESDSLIRPEDWVCLPISSDERFQHLSSIEDTIYNWADSENIILVKSKFDDRRLFLTNKYKMDEEYWSVNGPLVDEEHTHNHPCTLHYNRIITKGKQKLTPPSDIETMSKMIQNKTCIDEMERKKKAFMCSIRSSAFRLQEKEKYDLINVVADGFCGCRRLAAVYYGDEKKFWEVKMKMRDTLLNNESFYWTTFGDYILFNSVKESVCYGIEEIVGSKTIQWSLFYDTEAESLTVKAPRSNWFISPDAVQLAADTFRLPVAIYTENNYSEMFFPLLNTDVFHRAAEGSEATLPMSMILQISGNNHWVTFKSTRKIKKMN
ncbi:hypothetical protein G6F56_010269 [Rhizopus delemar]|nr:hypothetical protein G6F56_010269 [Rhizopus delemar]